MSSKSTTPNSTSTFAYSHEPFETFQSKVTLLTQSFGDYSQVNVIHVKGGSYNRTVAVTLVEGETSIEGIFRIPRFSDTTEDDGTVNESVMDDRILNHAAVLQFLSNCNVASPRLLAFDTTAANEIGSPYTLQAFSTGSSLADEYSKMTASAKHSIVDSLVAFLVLMQSIRFPRPGVLCVAADSASVRKRSVLSDTRHTPIKIKTRGFKVWDNEIPPKETLYELLSTMISAWTADAGSKDDSDGCQMWSQLSQMSEEMKDYGFFAGKQLWDHLNVLYHWDLEPRNILIRPKPNTQAIDDSTEWIIDTIIDWDDVYCVPPVLTWRPPVWLWDFSDDIGHSSLPNDYDGDIDLIPLDRYTPENGRLTPENRELKAYFEQQYVEKLATIYPNFGRDIYEDHAYGRGRWIRRLARFAIDGASYSQDLKRFDRLAEEWTVAREEYKSK